MVGFLPRGGCVLCLAVHPWHKNGWVPPQATNNVCIRQVHGSLKFLQLVFKHTCCSQLACWMRAAGSCRWGTWLSTILNVIHCSWLYNIYLALLPLCCRLGHIRQLLSYIMFEFARSILGMQAVGFEMTLKLVFGWLVCARMYVCFWHVLVICIDWSRKVLSK